MIFFKVLSAVFILTFSAFGQVQSPEGNNNLAPEELALETNDALNQNAAPFDSPDLNLNLKDISPKVVSPAFDSKIKIGTVSDAQRFSRFAGAAYCSNPTLASWRCTHCHRAGAGVKVVKIMQNLLTGSRAFIAVDNNNKQIILTFRGSYNIRNWLANLKFIAIPYLLNAAVGSGATIHAGFKQYIDSLAPQYIPIIKRLLAQHSTYQLIITGHSLGGAAATLATLDIQESLNIPWNRIQVFTYGAPRVGNTIFANYVNSLPITFTRVTNNRDIVPHVPPRILGFTHNQLEMFLEISQQPKICSKNVLEDSSCSLSKEPVLLISDHLTYFDGIYGLPC